MSGNQEMSEETALAILEGREAEAEIVSEAPVNQPTRIKTLTDLEFKIKQILAVTFLCESKQLRGDRNRLPIEEADKVYRGTPTVYFYINKQRDHIMLAIKEYLRNQKAEESNGDQRTGPGVDSSNESYTRAK